MSYDSLYKLFFKKQNEFNSIYENKFNSSSTVKLDLMINNNIAFFSYDKEIISYVSRIRELDIELSELIFDLPDYVVKYYKRSSLINEISSTNEIEGVISTKKEINDLINDLEKNVKVKSRFQGIVKKYLNLENDKIKLETSNDIRTLYNELILDEIKEEDINNLPDGKIFRKNIVHIISQNSQIIHSGISNEKKIIEYMDKALNILNNKEIDILIRIAVFHYLFGYIHPFYDGNGRINRFISSYYLSKYMNNLIGYKLSESIKENIKDYLDSFKHTNDVRNKGDISTFVYEFLKIIHSSYMKIVDSLLKISFESSIYLEKIESFNLPTEEYSLLVVLINNTVYNKFGLSKFNIQNILKKGATIITAILNKLEKKDLCKQIRSGRHIYYVANLEKIKNM